MDKVFYSLDYRKEIVLTVNIAIDRLYNNIMRENCGNVGTIIESNMKKYLRDEHAIRTTLTILGITSKEIQSVGMRSYNKLTLIYDILHAND